MEILDFQINFFGDEVNMWIYNDADTSWRISFLACYKVSYETDATWRGIPYVRDMKKPQLGYYGQDITISESEEFKGFYSISMNLTIIHVLVRIWSELPAGLPGSKGVHRTDVERPVGGTGICLSQKDCQRPGRRRRDCRESGWTHKHAGWTHKHAG